MSFKVKTNIKAPLGWIEDYDVWCCIEDYTDKELYFDLDSLYRIIVDGASFGDDEEFKNMTIDQLKEEYNKKFPLLLANFFENLAKDIKSGELEIKTEF